MFLVNLFFLKHPSSSHSHRRYNQIAILIIGDILLVLLVVLMTVAITPIDEQFGEEDIPFLEIGRMARDFFSDASILVFELVGFLAVVRVEYLRGHIGEKRFADRIVRTNSLFILRAFFKTAPYRAVFSVFSVHSG